MCLAVTQRKKKAEKMSNLFLSVEIPSVYPAGPIKPREHYSEESRLWFFHMLGTEMKIAADKQYLYHWNDDYKSPIFDERR